jgi:hypothetical protein
LSDPAVISPAEVDRKYLVASDKVMGLLVGNEARAYPLRLLVWHEVVNDVVGGVPVVVTYHPITEGLAVFDRRIGTETLQFGVSGLLFQSNLLLYDRAPAPHNLAATVESLWSQLQGRAIAGPHAARRSTLTLVPFALCRWSEWVAAHPATTVVAPIAGESDKYGRDVYATYTNTETLRYPVDPLPPPGPLAVKTRIFAAPGPGGFTVTPLRVAPTERRLEVVGPSGTTPAAGYYAYWFAWYATHPDAPGAVVRESAASSPERTASGMPTAPAALPATASPGIAAAARATSASHDPAPTPY